MSIMYYPAPAFAMLEMPYEKFPFRHLDRNHQSRHSTLTGAAVPVTVPTVMLSGVLNVKLSHSYMFLFLFVLVLVLGILVTMAVPECS
jgi:hypothetical protein